MDTYLQSAELDSLYSSLTAAQADGLIAIEASENSQVRSRYADLVSVWNAIRPVLTRHQLGICQHVGRVRLEGEETVIGLRTTLTHQSGQYISDYGEFIIQFIQGRSGGVLSKTWACASAVTYLRRYALLSILGIVTGDDDDAQHFAQSLSAEPSAAPRTPRILTTLDDGDWAKYVGGEWRGQLGPDSRPLGSYSADELRNLVRRCIDEGGDSPALSAMIFDQIEKRLGVIAEDVGPALDRRGWTRALSPGGWTLSDFRDAYNVLLQEPKPAPAPHQPPHPPHPTTDH